MLGTVAALALVVFTATAWAAAPEVQAEVIPASVELPPQGEVEVLVIARNPDATLVLGLTGRARPNAVPKM